MTAAMARFSARFTRIFVGFVLLDTATHTSSFSVGTSKIHQKGVSLYSVETRRKLWRTAETRLRSMLSLCHKADSYDFKKILPSYKILRDGTQAMIDELDPQQLDSAILMLNQSAQDWLGLGYEDEKQMLVEFKPKFIFAAYNQTIHPTFRDLIGLFFLSSNFPDVSAHICEGLIMTRSSFRQKGAGLFMGEVMQRIAKELHFSIQYQKFVYVNNPASVALCRSLGMKLLSILPRAGLVSGGRRPRYTDAMHFFLELKDNKRTCINEELETDPQDEYWMHKALELARKAEEVVSDCGDNSLPRILTNFTF
jgi:hypothetical protein